MLPKKIAELIDGLTRTLIEKRPAEFNTLLRRRIEKSADAGFMGSGMAFNAQIAVCFDHFREFAELIWDAFSRVLMDSDIEPYEELGADVRHHYGAEESALEKPQ